MPLPATAYDPMTDYSPALAMAAGQLASAEHPAGTVYVAEQADTFSAPFTLTEWDLASGKALQHAAMPVSAKDSLPTLLHAGDRLHMVAWGRDGTPYYFLLTPSLQVVAKSRVKGMAGGGCNALASDGSLTAVFASRSTKDSAHEYSRTFVATYDAVGQPIASRTLEAPDETALSSVLRDNVAVAGGSVYLLHHIDAGLRILRLAPDLHETASRPLTTSEHWPEARLCVRSDHLFAQIGPEVYDIPFDLSRASPAPASAGCPWGVTMGPVHAQLSGEVDGKVMSHDIEWDRGER